MDQIRSSPRQQLAANAHSTSSFEENGDLVGHATKQSSLNQSERAVAAETLRVRDPSAGDRLISDMPRFDVPRFDAKAKVSDDAANLSEKTCSCERVTESAGRVTVLPSEVIKRHGGSQHPEASQAADGTGTLGRGRTPGLLSSAPGHDHKNVDGQRVGCPRASTACLEGASPVCALPTGRDESNQPFPTAVPASITACSLDVHRKQPRCLALLQRMHRSVPAPEGSRGRDSAEAARRHRVRLASRVPLLLATVAGWIE